MQLFDMNVTIFLLVGLLFILTLNGLMLIKLVRSTKNVQYNTHPNFTNYNSPTLLPLSKLDENQLEDLSSVIEEIKQESTLIGNQKIAGLCLFLQNAVMKDRQYENIVVLNEKSTNKFKDRLLTYHKDLTESELELCLLIIQNKSGREVSEILNLTHGTIRVYKNKLKIKLGLSADDNLFEYLKNMYKS
jgi:DNA-binding CsgD family transcriptional regulator